MSRQLNEDLKTKLREALCNANMVDDGLVGVLRNISTVGFVTSDYIGHLLPLLEKHMGKESVPSMIDELLALMKSTIFKTSEETAAAIASVQKDPRFAKITEEFMNGGELDREAFNATVADILDKNKES